MVTEAVSPDILGLAGALLVVAGLVLGFRGRRVWETLLALLGILIGGVLGFLVGVVLAGILGGLVLALVGAVVGALLFGRLVELALAFLAGLLAAGLVFLLLAGPAAAEAPQAAGLALLAALLVLVVVFVLAYLYMDALVGVLTAFVGGALFGVGLFLVLTEWVVVPSAQARLAALGGGVLVLVLGAAAQTRQERS